MCAHCDWEEFIDECSEVMDLLEDLPSKADGYVSNVDEKVSGIQNWVEEAEHCTDNQKNAIANIRRGAERWMET